MAAAYRAAGQPEQAAITLFEGVSADPNDPAGAALASQLVDVYKQIDPQGCALSGAGGSVSLNLDCPLVRGHLCTASRNLVRLFLETGRPDAANAQRRAIGGLGCPAVPPQ